MMMDNRAESGTLCIWCKLRFEIRSEDVTRVRDAYWKCDQKMHPHNKPPTQASEKAQPEERGRGETQEGPAGDWNTPG